MFCAALGLHDRSTMCDTSRAKVAVTVRAAFIVSVHVPVPVHAPLQPTKFDPASGVAVSVTTVPLLNVAPHVVGQAIPTGLLAADPPQCPPSSRSTLARRPAAI